MFDSDSALPGRAMLDGREFGHRLQELDAQLRHVESQIAATITAAKHAGAYCEDGHSTIAGWCRAQNKWSTAETAARIRTARLAEREPAVAEALAAGTIGVPQARLLGRAAANPRCGDQIGDVLPLLLQHAVNLPYEDFRLVVRRWEMLADTDGTRCNAEAAQAARSASFVEAGDELILRANCDKATGAALKEIFDRSIDDEWQHDWDACTAEHGDNANPTLLARTDPQRRFDALAAIFLRAASTPADGQQPEPLVNPVIDTVTLERLLDDDDPATAPRPDDPRWWRSETTDGQPVPPDDIITAMIWDAVHRVVIDRRDGTVLDVGRRRRLFTGRARTAVLLASARYTWPGCLRPSSRTQADHRTEHQHGGATDVSNGDPCCPKHNRHKSANGYTVTRDEHGYLHHHRPDGTEIGCSSGSDP